MMDTPNQGIALLGAFLFSLAGVFNLYQIRRLKEGKKEFFNYEIDILNQAKFMEAVRISNNEDRAVLLSEIN